MRKMDYTIGMYAEICKALQPQKVVTVQQYLSDKGDCPCIVLRHDVDRDPQNALAMAKLEHQHGIRSTYYFRYPHTFDITIIKKIYGLGHEIGYHYEVLDKAKGDFLKAIEIFREELDIFRKYFPVKTVCMHGNPLTKWDGRELWNLFDLRSFGLLGEAFLSCGDIPIYLTDTGRNWNGANNFKDKLKAKNELTDFRSTIDVIRFLYTAKEKCIYINCHPERWGSGIRGWFKAFIRDALYNFAKKILLLFRSICS